LRLVERFPPAPLNAENSLGFLNSILVGLLTEHISNLFKQAMVPTTLKALYS
jgi:hypothetical protein